MIPIYTYRKNHHDWELTQDGYVLGYMKRSVLKKRLQSQAGDDALVLRVSQNGNIWHDAAFHCKRDAREYLQSL